MKRMRKKKWVFFWKNNRYTGNKKNSEGKLKKKQGDKMVRKAEKRLVKVDVGDNIAVRIPSVDRDPLDLKKVKKTSSQLNYSVRSVTSFLDIFLFRVWSFSFSFCNLSTSLYPFTSSLFHRFEHLPRKIVISISYHEPFREFGYS